MKIETHPIKTGNKFNLVSAILAFIIWGSWAYYVNQDAGITSGVVSALVQGTASFIITLFMVYAVTWIFNCIESRALKLILPPVLTVTFTGSCLILVHYFVGTHDIFHTITPALLVGFFYCAFTALKLKRFLINMEMNDHEKK